MWKNPKSGIVEARRRLLRAKAKREPYLRPCTKCSDPNNPATWKMSTEFMAHSIASDGLRPSCRACDYKALDKAKRKANRKRVYEKRKARLHRARLRERSYDRRKKNRWLSLSEMKGFFYGMGHRTYLYLSFGGMFLPPYFRLPRPAWIKGRRLWSRKRLEKFEDQLYERRAELYARLNPKKWTLSGWKAELDRVNSLWWRPWKSFKPGGKEYLKYSKTSQAGTLANPHVRAREAVPSKLTRRRAQLSASQPTSAPPATSPGTPGSLSAPPPPPA